MFMNAEIRVNKSSHKTSGTGAWMSYKHMNSEHCTKSYKGQKVYRNISHEIQRSCGKYIS